MILAGKIKLKLYCIHIVHAVLEKKKKQIFKKWYACFVSIDSQKHEWRLGEP